MTKGGLDRIADHQYSRSRLAEHILMIREEIFFKMIKEVRVKYRFENFSYNQRKVNRSVVGGVGVVTLLRNRLNKCALSK